MRYSGQFTTTTRVFLAIVSLRKLIRPKKIQQTFFISKLTRKRFTGEFLRSLPILRHRTG
jgi:hypothetical protein